MTNDIVREALKALVGRIQQTCDDNQDYSDGDVAYELRWLLLTDEYKSAEQVLKPNRKEIADFLERYRRWVEEDGVNARVGHFSSIEGQAKWFNYAIEELRQPRTNQED